MTRALADIIASYDRSAPLSDASTIPSEWYTDPRVDELERRTAFSRGWQVVARVEQLEQPGQFVACETPGHEPIVLVRGNDNVLRGFFNVCRHHAAAVATEPEGKTESFRCPYHGWTYNLEGALILAPEIAGVHHFDRTANGLVPIETAVWEGWVLARLEQGASPLKDFLGADLIGRIAQLGLQEFHWTERRTYTLRCNWKVFIDNYLDGGYHVPHLHRGLDSVLNAAQYTVETGPRFCLQSSPLSAEKADEHIAAVRGGNRALYYWLYPNFMINWYEGVMDTNIVRPRGVDQTEVVFDFYFAEASARERNLASIALSERIQAEDVAICESVQHGLTSRAFTTGRLSVRREAGEHLFHRLLYTDLKSGLSSAA